MTLRIGIVGAGSMGLVHAEAWSNTPARVAGFVSRNPDNARRLAAQHGTMAFATLDAMLPYVDVVDICTPTVLHCEQALVAARAGKHVVCEKPLARTVEQAEQMIAACRAAGVKLLVAHVVRYFDAYASARERLAERRLGAVRLLSLSRLGRMPSGWFADSDASGGVLLDLMIHDYDFARWVAGEVVRVSAHAAIMSVDGAPAQHALVTLMHASGAISHVEGSWANPGPFRTFFRIAADHGLIEHDTALASPSGRNPYVAQAQAFYEALVGDAPLRVTAEDGLAALRIALAAVESADFGREVWL